MGEKSMQIKIKQTNVGFTIKCLSAFVLAAMFVSSGDALARSPELEKVIKGAKKEGVLKLLWTEGHMGADAGISDMLKSINKRYGTNIKLQFTQGRSFPANLGRLTQEHRAKQTSSTDVFMGSGSHMLSGFKTGMLQKVDWNKLIDRPEPKNALVKQYTALLKSEDVHLSFKEDAIDQIAEMSALVNLRTENIGARRLQTIMEKFLEDISFDAPDLEDKNISIDASYIREKLKDIIQDEDLSRYIL